MSATEPERLRGALGPVKQIAAGVLDIGYVDVGPSAMWVLETQHGFWSADSWSNCDGTIDLWR